ncbi:MAG: BamA/TamA family outer membrane protein [Bacteroidales bacterium]|nr:BamA/TamA family outer membrane protein [Bacteroidales bacterium]
MKCRSRIFLYALAAVLCACSTTRVLAPGEYRLAKNTVKIEGKNTGVSTSDVSSYVRQKANSDFIFGWNPSLNIYNWSDPSKDDWWNNALRSIGTAPVVFNEMQVISSRDNIAKHLDYLGYYNSTVTSKIDTVRRLVKVTYNVTPGKRCRIDSIVYKVPEGEFSKEFKRDIARTLVHPGDWLSEKLLEEESVRGTSWFRNRGYYDFTKYNYIFEADTLGPRNILTYEIREYSRNELSIAAQPLRKYSIGKVTIEHSAEVPFRESVLRNINVIHPGDPYSEFQITRNYNRFTSLRLFNNVGLEMIPVDTTTVDCHITLGESKLQGAKVNFEASTNSSGLFGVSPQVSFYHKNIFHGGEWLSLGFTGNFQWKPGTDTRALEFGVNTGLSFPRFLGLPYSAFPGSNIPRTEILASLSYQNRPEFLRWIGTFSYGYSGRSRRLQYQVYPLHATVIKASKITDAFFNTLLHNIALWDSFYDHIDAGLSGQLYWSTSTDIVPKGSYTFARLAFDSSGNVISLFDNLLPVDEYGDRNIFGLGYSQYVRMALQFGHTFNFGPDTKLAVHFDGGAGYAYGSSSSMPFEKQFFAGGASSMRGWQAHSLGPGADELVDYFIIPSQYGDWKLEVGAELRQKLFWKFEGALFAEAGNVWSYYDYYDNWPATIAADWGLGLRLNLNFILLRLDWGVKLYEPCQPAGERWRLDPSLWFNKNGCALHFGVGYPF